MYWSQLLENYLKYSCSVVNRQTKMPPDYEHSGGSDHCFRDNRISSEKAFQAALLRVTTTSEVQSAYTMSSVKL